MKSQEPKDRSPKLQGMLLSAYCLLFTILCLISPVLAAEEGGHDAGGDNSTLWLIINFAILAVAVILIARYLKLKDFFASRKENIKRELDEAQKAKQEIKGEIAKVAVEMAEEILRHELTAADQERLIREYLEKVRLH